MKLALVFGLPGSGKTSFAVEKFGRWKRLNRDSIGGKMSGLLLRLEDLLKAGKNVVMDNLFTTAEDRKPFIKLGKKYGAQIKGEVT